MISEIILKEVTASYGSASAVGSLEEDWIESCHGGVCEVSTTKDPSILNFQKETKIDNKMPESQKYSSIVIKNILDSFYNH